MMSSVTAAGRNSRTSRSPSWPPRAVTTAKPARSRCSSTSSRTVENYILGVRRGLIILSGIAAARLFVHLFAAATLLGRVLHQHKLHLSNVDSLRSDHARRILLKYDRLVLHKIKQFAIEFHASLLPLH
jgi:hypothetical protein